MKKIYLLAILIWFFNLTIPATGAERTYYLAVIPMYSPELIFKYYNPLVNYLNMKTNKKWSLKLVHSHKGLIEELCNKKIDVVFTGPVPFSIASERCNVKPLLAALGKHGRPYYNSVIFTADPNIDSLNELSGASFGFLKGSTLAHVVPFKILEEAGVKVQTVQFRKQEDIVRAVLDGRIKAGGVKMSVFEKFTAHNLKAIKVSEDIPQFLFSAHSGFDHAAEKALVTALLNLKPLKNKSHMEITKDWDEEARYGFVVPDREYLQKITELSLWTRRFITDF